ncbi:hypothetical protein TIFTF001_034318 [Ficus carica]|uniref:Uncharacterized protein n=1 Tax=Ficus carica TaxID=3494 RepID=A0AA88E2K0_FICCA|nr:hypothetical protein TIFTF001_034318 [Ficus carica]
MSDVTDSENEALSGSVDVTGDSDTGASLSMSSSSSTPITPTSRCREGAARLVEILQVGPGTHLDNRFICELGRAASEPPVQATSTGVASERSAGQASTSGREGTESSDSPDPAGELLGDRDRQEGRAMCINNQRGLSCLLGRLLHICRDPGIPCCPQEGLPDSHLAQLNANAYRILVGCFILWAKNFAAELPFRAFQNLYQMKSAPSSTGSYYFQGFKGTFVAKCPDSDKQFKHLWFYAGGRWLHGHLARNKLPRSERVSVVFRNGYVWTRAPHIPETTQDMVAGLQNLAEHERDQRTLLNQSSLSEHGWLGFASTSQMPIILRPEPITVARMPEPTVYYRSRSTTAPAEATPDQPETRGVESGVPLSQLPHGDTSPGSWGPRIADEDLDLMIRRLSPVRGQLPARGLRIDGRQQSLAEHSQQPLIEIFFLTPFFLFVEPMADRRGTKRPTKEDRRERLAKMANLGKGKGKAGTFAPPSRNVAPPITRATPAPPAPAIGTAATPTPAPQTSRPPGFSRDD